MFVPNFWCWAVVCALGLISLAVMKRLFLLAVFLCFLFFVQAKEPLLLVAHRGGAAWGVENTLSCIERSILLGARALEVDVRMTDDGHLVVFHDSSVAGRTNGRGKVRNLTLAQIKSLDIVDDCGRVTGERIPALGEVLRLVNGSCRLLIEVKCGSWEAVMVASRLYVDIVENGAEGWVSVQSFNDKVLRCLHALEVSFPLEKLVVFKVPLLPVVFDGSFHWFSVGKYSYVSSFNFHKSCLSRSFAAKLAAAGKGVKVWTLTAPSDLPPFMVDGAISDVPF